MTRRKRPTLIAEIGRLLVEYPEKDWKALADRMRDQVLMEEIAIAVDDALTITPKSATKKKRNRKKSLASLLAEVGREDEAKAKLLSDVMSQLNNKHQPVTLSFIRAFANSIGMKDEIASRREQAVNQIFNYLVKKTAAEIAADINKAVPSENRSGQEFDRWVNLILGDDQSKSLQRKT